MITYRTDTEAGLVIGSHGMPIGIVGGSGYVEIRRGGRYVSMAHRIIWESVNGQIPDGLEINHINGIKTDNRIANLELVTSSQNRIHAYRTGLMTAVGERNGRSKLTLDQVRQIRASNESARSMARSYGVSETTIRDVVSGRRWACAA